MDVFQRLAKPALTPNQQFVNDVYRVLLQRSADSTGLAFWTGQLDQGLTSTQVVQAIEGSLEYRIDAVASMYQSFLHRTVDNSGLAVFTTALGAGSTVEQVQGVILGSAEYFQTRGGGTNAGFLSAIYQDTLQRG